MKIDKSRIDAEAALVEIGSFLVQCESPEDEEFCRMVAAGSSARAAALATKACGQGHTTKFIRRPDIAARINYLRHTACAKVDVTIDGLLAELMILKEQAWQRKDHKAVQSLINDIARLGGLGDQGDQAPKMGWKEVVEAMADQKGITLEQMRAIARQDAEKRSPDLPPPHKRH